jgi:lipopolysaccharide/colanic/teichoic acid biosynthesis glycosyltransferase
MLKEHSLFIKHAIALFDCATIAVLFGVAHALVVRGTPLEPVADYWFMFLGFLVFYVYFAWTRSLFSVLQFTQMPGLARRVAGIFLWAAVLGAAILYLVPGQLHSRRLYLVFVGLSFAAIGLEKLALRFVFMRLRRRNRNTTPVLLFGRGRLLSRIAADIEANPQWGLRVRGKLDLGTPPEQFSDVLARTHVEEVLFCVPRSASIEGFDIDPFLQVCEQMGRPSRVFLNVLEATSFASWQYHPFMGRPSLVAHSVELDPDQLLLKRLFDLAGGVIGVCLLALVYPAAAAAIKMSSAGPVFTREERFGRNGRRFRAYAFRCTRTRPDGAMEPTPAGRALRRLHLCELPRILNVVGGQMSMVGTRPLGPAEPPSGHHPRRFSVKPGITGLWRVHASGTSVEEDARLDLNYVDSWTLWLDLRIIVQTLVSLVRRGVGH